MSQYTPRLRVIDPKVTPRAQDQLRSVPHPRRSWLLGSVLALCLGVLAGCGEKTKKDLGPMGTVSGVVKLKGTPLTSGRVNFMKVEGDAGGSGILGEGGQYKLDEPIPVGEYNVFISFEFSPEALRSGLDEALKSVPKKYRSVKTSKLKKKVNEGPNEYPIELN